MTNSPVSARTHLLAHAVLAAGFASQAHAYLGSFTPNDGYDISVYSGSVNWSDVSYYNSGNYGANAGGGSGPTLISPDSGKWKVVGGVGGYFTSAAARSAALAGAPPYPTTIPSGTLPIYIVGDHGPGRTDGSSLAFRNDTALGTVGAAKYKYTIDSYDTGGTIPSTITSGTVSYGIYFSTSPSDPRAQGTLPADRFTQSLIDSSGNIGMQWGYARDNELLYRGNASGPWTYTGVYANAGQWDGISINVNLSAGTFSFDYYNVVLNSWSNIAPAGTPLGIPMTNFTALGWQLEDGTNGGVGGKNFFDDAKFNIPAPSSLGLLGIGALTATRRRRRA